MRLLNLIKHYLGEIKDDYISRKSLHNRRAIIRHGNLNSLAAKDTEQIKALYEQVHCTALKKIQKNKLLEE